MSQENVVILPSDKKSCELWTGSQWEIHSVSDILPDRTALVRCYECQGPISLMSSSHNGRNEAHFEHHPNHSGCSLAHRIYSGIPSLHPNLVSAPPEAQVTTDYISEKDAMKIIGSVTVTEKERLLQARVGQGEYRKKLLKRWKTCSVLGCGPQSALIASHIVSWKTCDNNGERLDPDNGLLLSPNLDKLFDRGMISFSACGKLLISKDLDQSDATALGIRPDMQLRTIHAGVLKYLARHRADGKWAEFSSEHLSDIDKKNCY